MKEADLQRAVSDYLQYKMNTGELYFDRLNAGSILSLRNQRLYKIQLCRPGTSDFIILKLEHLVTKKTETVVLFIELKVKHKQTPEQKEFQRLVEKFGAEYHLIRSIDELQNILKV